MKGGIDIAPFMLKAGGDMRIGPMHISLYLAILHLGLQQGAELMIEVSARKLKPLAKIGGLGPYHRTIRQLHEFGYIRYEPSNNPAVPSRVYLGDT